MPEAALHLLEAVVARSVAETRVYLYERLGYKARKGNEFPPEVELSDIARSLVTEGQALLTGQRGVNGVASTAGTMVAPLRSAVLHLGGRFDGAIVGFEVHRHQLKPVTLKVFSTAALFRSGLLAGNLPPPLCRR